VAARVASEKFVQFFERFVKENSNITVELVKDTMKQAILYVNKQLIEYHHPKTQQKIEIMDLVRRCITLLIGLQGRTNYFGRFLYMEIECSRPKEIQRHIWSVLRGYW
jgi:hypothetical protein